MQRLNRNPVFDQKLREALAGHRLVRIALFINRWGLRRWRLGSKLACLIRWLSFGKILPCRACQLREAALNGHVPSPKDAKDEELEPVPEEDRR